MGGESLSPDLGPLALQPSVADLHQALDALRERLDRLERVSSQSAPPAREGGVTLGDDDPQALGIVQEILSIPSSGLHPSDLFTLAMDRASRLLAADRAMLFVAESGGARLVPRSAHGFRREDLESTSVRPGEGIVGRVFKERRVLAHTAGSDGEAPDAFIERFPVHDAIAVPVRAEDDVAGVLYVGRRRLGAPFSANDVLLLLVIADRVGGGLVHQALLDRRTRHISRLAELGGFAARVLAARPLSDVLADACEAGCRLVDVRAAAVAVAGEPGEVKLLAARGLPVSANSWRPVSIRDGLTAELYAGEEFVACRDVQSLAAPDRSFLGDGGFRGCLLLPLRLGTCTAGVFYLADTEVRDFSAEEIEAARVLAAMGASAVESDWSGGDPPRVAPAGARASPERVARIEKARALGEMAGGLARELDNVFAIILGKSRLLLAHAHDEPLREGLEVLEEAAWRGADVVHRLIALAAPTPGEATGPVDMTALIQDVIALTRPRWKDEAEGRGACIDLVTDLGSAPPVLGSETALREALRNLVLNAVDAMPRGGRLSLVTRPREGGVELALEDTGEGIAEDVRSRIFDPFFTTRSPKRMGVGLTVAQGVVTRYDGCIDISSVPGSGTRVTVWLPGVEGQAAAAQIAAPAPSAAVTPDRQAETDSRGDPAAVGAAPEAGTAPPPRIEEDRPRETEEAPPRGAGEPPRSEAASILVLEDEAPVRSLLVEALTQAGHKVEAAADGSSGLAKLQSGRFDVVLTDLALPQRSGLAIARSVKLLHPHTRVVLITGWGHLLDPERLREHGIDLMLVKPFRIERVLSVVGDALRLRSPS